MAAETTKLTIRLPTRDVEFAKAYASAHGLTVTEVIDRYLRRMRALEERMPVPELDEITGLVPADVDVEAEYQAHLREKHSR
ncbi:DUF6364 family protein [Arhodomonas aquaeolei]|uniref:DUF6364 family protein n=1 Tax=Arhodomonas aquaeolei TaxID=2369 RepID=UPI000362A7DB|nr:DUF6364 family protein [Arhodomonas aquaeolei]